jgi:predicted Zn-dependent protease
MGEVVHGGGELVMEDKYHSPMKLIRSIAAALLVAYPAAITTSGAARAIELPDLGEVSRTSLSEAQEDRIGREIMRQIRESADYLDDAVIAEYLENLGDRLAAASPSPGRHFEFFPVRDPSINAFALPGGYVGVHTGLISAARNESELAGVLSHEIAHVTQNHIARMVDGQKSSTLVSLAALAVAILAARSNSQVSQAAIVGAQALSIQSQLDYTRENEREADRVGLQTLDAAGFSPQGMGSFFERLQAQGRVYENNAPAYLRTHPLTYERIADMQNRLGSLPYRQLADSPEFSLVRARIQAAEGEAKDAVAAFEIQVRENPASAAWYGLAQAAMRVGNMALAERALAGIDGSMAKSPLVAVARVDLALARGRVEEALELSRIALSQHSAYRPLAYLRAKALLRANRPRDALDFLAEQQRAWPSEGNFHVLRAEAHNALGQAAQAHLSQAEAYALTDRIAAAMEQLQLAQRAGKADFYTLSIIDARLRDLRERERKDGTADAGRAGK